jgi:CBS domain-containing protein
MSKDVSTIDMNESVFSAAANISKKAIGCLIVVKNRQAIGIVTEQDIVTKVTANAADPKKVYVKDIMSTPVISVKSMASLREAAELMTEYKVRRLAVVEDDGALSGLITTEDLARWLAKQGNYEDPALNAIAKVKGGPYQ